MLLDWSALSILGLSLVWAIRLCWPQQAERPKTVPRGNDVWHGVSILAFIWKLIFLQIITQSKKAKQWDVSKLHNNYSLIIVIYTGNVVMNFLSQTSRGLCWSTYYMVCDKIQFLMDIRFNAPMFQTSAILISNHHQFILVSNCYILYPFLSLIINQWFISTFLLFKCQQWFEYHVRQCRILSQ